MKKFNVEFKWAIILYLLTIMWSLIEKTLGYHDEKIASLPYFSLLYFIFVIIVYIKLAFEKKEKYYNGIMTWQQGMVSGVIMSFIFMLTCPFAQLVIHNIISPKFFENAIKNAVDTKIMKLEQAKNFFNLTSYILQSSFTAISFGIVFAGIAGFVTQTKTKQTTK